ncbi:MAG: hypothetical protein Crog4KO_06420 [Crocinitomicaceae bacterium]
MADSIDINEDFRIALVEHMPEVDQDGDSYISTKEAQSVTEIVLVNVGLSKVEGLKCFPNLERLILTRNELKNISIVGLPKLRDVYCLYNKLESITLDSLPELIKLLLDDNNLCELRLDKVPTIEYLSCGYNKIKQLDITALQNLARLGIVQNLIETMDISQNQNLVTFQFQYNPMIEMDLSQNPNLVFDDRFSWGQNIKLIATDEQMKSIMENVKKESEYQDPPPADD